MATVTLFDNLNNSVKSIYPIDYSIIEIKDLKPSVTIQEILPFRVRFTSITIDGYSASNPPPIPLQVIGFSNYIL